MRVQEKNAEKILCNCCGRELTVEKGIVKEEYISILKTFGYFSKKDGTKHRLDVCEDCYDKWLESFAIPVETSEETELL